ncbi:hypothetical protein PMAYCL1PPCAC_03047, partial [Pristionchus mayeri]
STFWTQLPIEENPKVRCALLSLGFRLVTTTPFHYKYTRSHERRRRHSISAGSDGSQGSLDEGARRRPHAAPRHSTVQYQR